MSIATDGRKDQSLFRRYFLEGEELASVELIALAKRCNRLGAGVALIQIFLVLAVLGNLWGMNQFFTFAEHILPSKEHSVFVPGTGMAFLVVAGLGAGVILGTVQLVLSGPREILDERGR